VEQNLCQNLLLEIKETYKYKKTNDQYQPNKYFDKNACEDVAIN